MAGKTEAGRWLSRTPPFRAGLLGGLGLLVVFVFWLGLGKTSTLLTALVVAGFLATGLNQAVKLLTRKGVKRGLAVGIVIGAILLLGCGGLSAIIPAVVTQTAALIESMPQYIDDLVNSELVQRFGGLSDIVAKAEALVTGENLALVAGGVVGGVSTLAAGIGWMVTTVLLSFFVLAAYDRILKGTLNLFPASKREEYGGYADAILQQVGYYLVGALIIASIAGISAWIFMVIAGVPYAAILALFVAITDLIPNIGATLGAIAVIGVSLTVSLWTGIAALIFITAYQQIENWLIYPRIMGKAVKISNLAAIVCVLLGGTLFGLVGIVLSIPTYAGIRYLHKEIVQPKLDAA